MYSQYGNGCYWRAVINCRMKGHFIIGLIVCNNAGMIISGIEVFEEK